MTDRIREKLQILADAAKYDVSCSSSGSNRKNKGKGLGIQETVSAIVIQKMVAVFHCLKFYFQMSVFLIVRTVFLDALMMSNEPRLPYKKWWI
jgi:hypothetical protein